MLNFIEFQLSLILCTKEENWRSMWISKAISDFGPIILKNVMFSISNKEE